MKNVTRIICRVLIIAGMLNFTAICLAEEITIVGAGSGVAILKAVAAAFSQRFPDVTITLPASISSAAAIKVVGRDEALVGRIAREIQEQEQPYGLTYVPYAQNPIVFFVHPSVGIAELTTQHILDIYSGKITNWQDVGGRDLKIRVIRREDGDSSLGVLQTSFPGYKELTVTALSKTTLSDPETIATVEITAGAIAYGTYPNAKNAQVTILKIAGKSATDSDYPYLGTLALIFKKKNQAGTLKNFVEFMTSETARKAISSAGGIPFYAGGKIL